jgi:hypothetical protein
MSDPKTDKSSDTYSDEEIALRRDDVIRRMANTPPKPHSEMKIGKPIRKRKPSPAAKGQPKKQPPQSGAKD